MQINKMCNLAKTAKPTLNCTPYTNHKPLSLLELQVVIHHFLSHKQQRRHPPQANSPNTRMLTNSSGSTLLGQFRPPLHPQPTSSCPLARRRQRHAVVTAAAAASDRPSQRGSQRLFLDSADIKQWERWAPTGTLYGFTTNPLILDRDGVPCTLDSCKQLLSVVSVLLCAVLEAS